MPFLRDLKLHLCSVNNELDIPEQALRTMLMLVESSRGRLARRHLLDMGVKKELLEGMNDDDLEVLLDGFRAILATSEKTQG